MSLFTQPTTVKRWFSVFYSTVIALIASAFIFLHLSSTSLTPRILPFISTTVTSGKAVVHYLSTMGGNSYFCFLATAIFHRQFCSYRLFFSRLSVTVCKLL